MATNNNQGVPSFNYPVVDQNGILTTAWYQFLITLWQRTGGGAPPGNVQSVTVNAVNGIVGSVDDPNSNPIINLSINGTDVTNQLALFTQNTKGLTPASGGGITNFLRADGSWDAPPGTAGAVTVSGAPASGNLTKFSGAQTITNGNLSGDVTTANTLATLIAAIQGTVVAGTTGTGDVVFSTNSTLTGNTTIANLTVTSSGTMAEVRFSSMTGIIGSQTNDSAPVGSVGYFTSAGVTQANAVTMASTSSTNTVVLHLPTGGDWDVEGTTALLVSSGATMTLFESSISTSSGGHTTPDSGAVYFPLSVAASSTPIALTVPRQRVSLPSAANIYIVTQPVFSGGNVFGFGQLTARLAR